MVNLYSGGGNISYLYNGEADRLGQISLHRRADFYRGLVHLCGCAFGNHLPDHGKKKPEEAAERRDE